MNEYIKNPIAERTENNSITGVLMILAIVAVVVFAVWWFMRPEITTQAVQDNNTSATTPASIEVNVN